MLKMTALHDFNSQPREGGWASKTAPIAPFIYFNSQPREGGWADARFNRHAG